MKLHTSHNPSRAASPTILVIRNSVANALDNYMMIYESPWEHVGRICAK